MQELEAETLPVLVCRQMPVIDQNTVSVQRQLEAVQSALAAAPRNREGLARVKALRADLRKTLEALENQRKAVKKAVLDPYEQANAVYQERIASPIQVADAACKAFIDQVQGDIKRSCTDELKAYFDELVTARGIPWLTFDRCGVKVDMAVAAKKDFRQERERIAAFVEKVEGELAAISGLEDAPALLALYMQSLDLSRAMWQLQDQKRRLREAEKQNAENLRRTRERQKNVTEMARENPELAAALDRPQEKTYRVTFRVTSTLPMLRGLKAFLENNHYIYEEETT